VTPCRPLPLPIRWRVDRLRFTNNYLEFSNTSERSFNNNLKALSLKNGHLYVFAYFIRSTKTVYRISTNYILQNVMIKKNDFFFERIFTRFNVLQFYDIFVQLQVPSRYFVTHSYFSSNVKWNFEKIEIKDTVIMWPTEIFGK